MTKRSLLEFLQDILEAIADIESFTSTVDFDSFVANKEKVLAVLKLLKNIGEAVKQIPDDKRNHYPQIPWKSVAGTRDIFVHQYWEIDTDVVWATLQDSLPLLKTVIVQMAAQEETKP
jgi:uncharacterized protein with HEPN domain